MPRTPPFKETIEAWQQDMLNDPKISPNTVRTYIQGSWRVFNYAVQHDWPLNVKKLEPRHYSEYWRSIQGLSSKTQSTYMCAFSRLLAFAQNPYAERCTIDLIPVRGEVFWLERPQIIRLFRTAPHPRVLAAEVLFTYTGIRDFEGRELRTRSLTDNWLIVQSGKRRKGRKIPIDNEFWKMMDPYLEWKAQAVEAFGRSDYFMVHPRVPNNKCPKGPLVPYVQNGLSKMCMEHGLSLDPPIPHTNAHPFRRYFGRSLYEAGCPLSQIRDYYGHKTLAQTEAYIGINEQMSAEAMEKFRPKYLDEVRGREVA